MIEIPTRSFPPATGYRAARHYFNDHNDDPKPSVRTKPTDAIFAKLNRLPVLAVWVSAPGAIPNTQNATAEQGASSEENPMSA